MYVVRADRLAEYREDMGPTKEFATREFRILGGVPVGNGRYDILHTVGELCDIADAMHRKVFDYEEEHKITGSSIYDYLEQLDRQRQRKSTFGPKSRIQRS